VVSGRTRQNKLVHFPVPASEATLAPGTFASVRIVRAAPHFLAGQLVEVTSRPRTSPADPADRNAGGRVLIPVVAV
jgi:hypothetical protein